MFCLHLTVLFGRKEAVNTVLDAIKFYIRCYFSQTSEGHKLLRNCVSPRFFVLWNEGADLFVLVAFSAELPEFRTEDFISFLQFLYKNGSVISHSACSRRLPLETCICAYCSGRHSQFDVVCISVGCFRL
jgi:hypothetical protein